MATHLAHDVFIFLPFVRTHARSSGAYRDAFRLHRPDFTRDDVVLKRYTLNKKYHLSGKDQSRVHTEAIVMERMTPSRNIVDIYAHCGSSVIVETMAFDLYKKIVPGEGIVSQKTLDQLGDVHPLNNLTASEKLQISLSMAESLRDMHEFDGGVIVHSDTHIEQWLVGKDGSVKLNDFNYACALRWNDEEKAYCPARPTRGGTYRSPEEYTGKNDSDESKDTYAYSTCIYNILTGLWQFYDNTSRGVSDSSIRRRIVGGIRPFVDERYKTRSFIEGELVKIMVSCWKHERSDRPPMSAVVSFLREVKAKAIERGEMIPSSLIDIPME